MAQKKTTTKKVAVKKVAAKPAEKKSGPEVRKLQKQGNGTMTVALPVSFVRDLKWKDKQKLVVKKNGASLVITDWKK